MAYVHIYVCVYAYEQRGWRGGEGGRERERERWFRLLFWAFRVSKFRVLWLRVQGWSVFFLFTAVGFRAVGGFIAAGTSGCTQA